MSRAFRLASLLRLRTMQEERAAAELAVAAGATRAAEQQRASADRALAASALPAQVDVLHFQAGVATRAALAALATDAAVLVQRAAATEAEAQARWSEAKARSAALEKLEERHTATVRREEDRAEQLVLDEIGSRAAGTRPLGGEEVSS